MNEVKVLYCESCGGDRNGPIVGVIENPISGKKLYFEFPGLGAEADDPDEWGFVTEKQALCDVFEYKYDETHASNQ